MKTFGAIIREARLNKGLTLREFCRKTGFDPSHWSRIERGIVAPPKTEAAFYKIAEALDLETNSEKYLNLKETAFLEHLPTQLAPEKQILDNLPLFFKTARGQVPTEEEMRRLLNLIRGELNDH